MNLSSSVYLCSLVRVVLIIIIPNCLKLTIDATMLVPSFRANYFLESASWNCIFICCGLSDQPLKICASIFSVRAKGCLKLPSESLAIIQSSPMMIFPALPFCCRAGVVGLWFDSCLVTVSLERPLVGWFDLPKMSAASSVMPSMSQTRRVESWDAVYSFPSAI